MTATKYDWREDLVDDPELAKLLGHTAGPNWEEAVARPIHYNRPQLTAQAVGANEMYCIWGRGTGKTEGLIALRVDRCVQAMPRSHGVIVGASYAKILENTLPGTVKGLEALGYKRDVDFWIRKMPPKSANVPTPIVGPLIPDHCLFFRNGTVVSLVSQDRPGSANGKTVHWIIGDEAKLLNKAALDNELLMTNRGDERYFGGIPEFHSTLFASDMPTEQKAMWLLESEKRMDTKRIDLILSIRHKIHELEQSLQTCAPSRKSGIQEHIGLYLKKWDQLRGSTVYLSEAATLENIEGFGLKNLMKMKAKLPDFVWRTAILNKRPFLSEFTFYPDLKDSHFYRASDYDYIDSLGLTPELIIPGLQDCRKDADCDRDAPLLLAFDYGASINVAPTGQLAGRLLRAINSPYVRKPMRLPDLLAAWIAYYEPMREKTVYYIYDHTALGTDAIRSETYEQIVQRTLEEAGWDVEPIYLGHTTGYQFRYDLSSDVLRGGNPDYFDVAINIDNNEYMKHSLQNSNMKLRYRKGKGDDFEKDKAAEKDPNADQRETTHFSDGWDTLLHGTKMILDQGGLRHQQLGNSGLVLL